MINIAISGCNGKMGQVLSVLAQEIADFNILWGLDLNVNVQRQFPVYDQLKDGLPKPDVLIDFSHPSVLDTLIDWAVKNNVPCVIATTGLSGLNQEKLKQAAHTIPVFYSANMSLGVNVIIDIVKRMSKILEDKYDIEIIEKHHNQKIDAPSGTALAIADAINTVLSMKHDYIFDRHSRRRKRSKDEIGIHAVRGGTIVGEHSVIYAGNDEIIEIKHTALSKAIFAEGALKAARYISQLQNKPGLYNMQDMLNSI